MTEVAQDTETTETTEVAEDPKEETTTYTKDQLTAKVLKEVNKAKAQVVKDQVDPLKSQLAELDTFKTTAERAAAERDEFKTALEAAASDKARLAVALKTGLPNALVDRLKGETDEELEADALALLEIAKPSKSVSGFDGGQRDRSKPDEYSAALSKAFGL